jgi:hypothetical protein
MKYDLEKRIFLLEKYIKFENFAAVQLAYRINYKSKIAPNRSVILNIYSVFKKTGSVAPMPPKPKLPSQKRLEAQNQLKAMVADPTTFSSRKASAVVGISHTTVLSILHDDLHLKAYKYHQWHKLEVHDYEKRQARICILVHFAGPPS